MNKNRHTPIDAGIPRIVIAAALFPAGFLLGGCGRAPSFNLLGSFFPAWILCGLIGVLATAGLRLVFVRTKFEQELSPLVLVYPCLFALVTFVVWLVFFS